MKAAAGQRDRGRRGAAREIGRRLCRTWRVFRASLSEALPIHFRPAGHPAVIESLRAAIWELLDAGAGEAVSRSRAADLARNYLAAGARRRRLFLRILARDFGASADAVTRERATAADAKCGAKRREIAGQQRAPEDLRLVVLRRLGESPPGLKLLTNLRADLLAEARKDPAMRALAENLHRLLQTCFEVGLLQVQRVTWHSPTPILEKLIRHEAVHEIHGWRDLKNRLDAERRCFALFHPRMPDEPLAFVEVALCNGIAGNIQTLLDKATPAGDPTSAETAVFYSIFNCHKGLSGISFGHFLIKSALGLLAAELPGLKSFVTLSPIPGFANWLKALVQRESVPTLTPAEDGQQTAPAQSINGAKLAELLATLRWYEDEKVAAVLRGPLTHLCAYYLLQVRRTDGRRAADAVAHFHLRNGARVESLNWLADLSAKGLQQSHGLMVNYLYDRSQLERNAKQYVTDGTIAASPELRALAIGFERPR